VEHKRDCFYADGYGGMVFQGYHDLIIVAVMPQIEVDVGSQNRSAAEQQDRKANVCA
ncbi:MAG: hypothetical protein GY868_14115, partial [Deltaproteobacteria bacterium]|nr:hypothetical protein [Deltaproteobacteria bacterium]